MKFLWAKAYLLIFLFSFSVTSCVSVTRHKDLKSQNVYLQEENLKLRQDQNDLTEAQTKNQDLLDQIELAEDLLKELNAKYMGIRQSYDQLQSDYDKLGAQNNNILNATSNEKIQLETELAAKQDMLDKQEKVLLEKEGVLQIWESEIAKLNADLQFQKNELSSLRQKISEALASFSPEDLQVTQKANGQVYVSLSQKLLFKKGSDQIDALGQDAIRKLGVIIKDYELDIIVEGHTDADGTPQRNWELSTARATQVVKILQTSGVPPNRLIASGRALYVPVAENTTEENKSLNRRTEIIISPNMEGIFQLINKY